MFCLFGGIRSRVLLLIAMSVHSSTSTDQCKQCNEPFEDYYAPGFCSERCYFEHQGDAKLNLLRHDHRICANCGRWVKDISRPSEQWIEDCHSIVEHALKHGGDIESAGGELVLDITATETTTRQTAADSVIGFQTGTENSITVERESERDAAQREYHMAIGCVCGSTDTRTVDDTLRGLELATVLANYVLRFRELRREGQLQQKISKDVFFSAYRESENFEYALGRAFE